MTSMRMYRDKMVALVDQFDAETDFEKKVEILRQLRQVLTEERARLNGHAANDEVNQGTEHKGEQEEK